MKEHFDADGTADELIPHVARVLSMPERDLRSHLGRIGLSERRDLFCRSEIRAPFEVEVSRGFLMFTYGLASFFAGTVCRESDEEEKLGLWPRALWTRMLSNFIKDAMEKGLKVAPHLGLFDLNSFQGMLSEFMNSGAHVFALAHEFGHIIVAMAPGEVKERRLAETFVDGASDLFGNVLKQSGVRECWIEEIACEIIAIQLFLDWLDQKLSEDGEGGLDAVVAMAEKPEYENALNVERQLAETGYLDAGTILDELLDDERDAIGLRFSASASLCGMDLLLIGFQILEEGQRFEPSRTHPPAILRRRVLIEALRDKGVTGLDRNLRLFAEGFAENYVAPLLGDHRYPFTLAR